MSLSLPSIPQQTKDPTATLTRAGWLAVIAALVTIALKFTAYLLTGSAGLLSDAVESVANLVTAMTALLTVWYASRPVDQSHNYGHGKVEYFASGVEGTIILGAAAAIGWLGIARLLDPQPIAAIGAGGSIALVATAINFGVARLLLRVAREHRSPALEADGYHLLTDVWTSVGVLIGLGLVWLTGLLWLDAAIALVVGINIAWTGLRLIRAAIDGLMDRAFTQDDQLIVRKVIDDTLAHGSVSGAKHHALRTRHAGSRRFVDFHLLVPGEVSVHRAHDLANALEHSVERTLPGVETTVHIEPIEASDAWSDSAVLLFERDVDDPSTAQRHAVTPDRSGSVSRQ